MTKKNKSKQKNKQKFALGTFIFAPNWDNLMLCNPSTTIDEVHEQYIQAHDSVYENRFCDCINCIWQIPVYELGLDWLIDLNKQIK